jgi:hypothetical protein
VHRAALSLRAARRLAEQLGHDRVGRHAPRERLPVLAIGRDHVVVVAQGGERADRHRFLADVEMTEAADFAQRVRFGGFLFEPTDQEHLTQHAPFQLALGGRVGGLGGCSGHGDR